MPQFIAVADEGNFVRFEGPFEMVKGSEVLLPVRFIGTFPDDKGGPGIDMRFEMRDGRPECREIRILCAEDGREIRSADVRFAADVDKRMDEAACLVNAQPTGAAGPGGSIEVQMSSMPGALREVSKSVSRARRNTRRQIPDSQLGEIAEVVKSNPRAPNKAVMERFGISQKSASNYITRARKKGLLP